MNHKSWVHACKCTNREKRTKDPNTWDESSDVAININVINVNKIHEEFILTSANLYFQNQEIHEELLYACPCRFSARGFR